MSVTAKLCEICGDSETWENEHPDLCENCTRAIDEFQHDPSLLRKAVDYLEQFPVIKRPVS